MRRLSTLIFFLAVSALTARAAISISGLADKTKYSNTVTFTVTADPGATTTTATLDGQPITVGSPVTVTSVRYHELRAESRDAGGALVDSLTRRFIVRDNAVRGDSESGIPPHTPYNSVNDAPSAFAGGTLRIIAPAAWPVGFPVPMAAKLVDGSNETVRLNGLVSLAGFPGTTLKLRRGWGSVNAPALAAPSTVNVNAFVNGLTHNPVIDVQDVQAMAFTDVSGTISSNTTWPANSRMQITSTLTISAGATLTIGEGTIVLLDTGTATNGSAAEISVSGTLQINGTEANPVAFAPATPGLHWGGIELPAATSVVNATWAIFTGAGEDENWTANTSIDGPSHQSEQPVFALGGSGSGTAIGAQLHLNDCFSFEHAGQQMNSKTNVWVDLQRTLYQKCITSGELSGAKVTIDRSALIEFPSETGNFVDDDNDGLYLTNGDLSITNTVIGFTKDDGVDSGGGGGDSPFGTVNPLTGNTVTRFDSTNNWYEATYHEGNSLSGTRNVYFTGCVFLNCGQGVEAGYSQDSLDGPNAFVDGCLFVGNMVGMRVGDNYGDGYSYNSTADVKNSLILNSGFHDVWSYNWHSTNSNAWIYLDGTTNNTLGKPWFKVENNFLSIPDPAHHPLNTQWNPTNPAHAAQIAQFMPVPDSNVGVAISTYAAAQQDTTAYVPSHPVRLSTFSSQPVSVAWSVITKANPFSETGSVVAGGTLNFAPGETIKSINAPITTPGNFGLIHVALASPVNAEVTGEKVYVKLPGQTPNIITYGSLWKYKDDGSDQGTVWRNVGFNDSAWASGPAQLGYGDGDEATRVEDNSTPGYIDPDTNRYATTYFRRTFTVTDKSQIASLDLTLLYDDGGVVYINGQRVAATSGMPVDPAYNYHLGGTAPPDNSTLSAAVSPSVLVEGANTIAVEVHQQSNTSSDISFDARLTATISAAAPPLALNHTHSSGKPVFWWFAPGDILEFSTDLLNWFPYASPGSPVSVGTDKPKEFFRLRRP